MLMWERPATAPSPSRSAAARKARRVALQGSPLVAMEDDGFVRVPLDAGLGAVLLPVDMLRRGMARFERLWVRWTGPLGLAWRQKTVEFAKVFPVLPESGRCTTRARASSSATRSRD